MKRVLLSILISSLTGLCFGQVITPLSVTSGSKIFRNTGKQLSYSIGDVFVPGVKSRSGRNFTQAFYSNGLLSGNVKKPPKVYLNVDVYPNPTATIVNVRLSNTNEEHTVQVMDIFGRIVAMDQEREELSNGESFRIDLSSCLPGQYLIRLIPKHSRQGVTSFKIVKLDQ